MVRGVPVCYLQHDVLQRETIASSNIQGVQYDTYHIWITAIANVYNHFHHHFSGHTVDKQQVNQLGMPQHGKPLCSYVMELCLSQHSIYIVNLQMQLWNIPVMIMTYFLLAVTGKYLAS